MPLHINSVKELNELIAEQGLSISDLDDRRELLQTVNEATEQTPEGRKEQMAHQERLQESKQAHTERLRNVEHVERMRALELGQPLPDSGEEQRARSAIAAAGTIGVLVPLAMAFAAGLVSYLILRDVNDVDQVSIFGVPCDRHAALFSAVWGVCGLVAMLTVFLSLWTVRGARGKLRGVLAPQGRFGTGQEAQTGVSAQ